MEEISSDMHSDAQAALGSLKARRLGGGSSNRVPKRERPFSLFDKDTPRTSYVGDGERPA